MVGHEARHRFEWVLGRFRAVQTTKNTDLRPRSRPISKTQRSHCPPGVRDGELEEPAKSLPGAGVGLSGPRETAPLLQGGTKKWSPDQPTKVETLGRSETWNCWVFKVRRLLARKSPTSVVSTSLNRPKTRFANSVSQPWTGLGRLTYF